MASHEITVAYLNEALSADFENGTLFWKERPLTHFPSLKEMKRWNKRYAHIPTFDKTCRTSGYTVGNINKRTIAAHRVLLAMHMGSWPSMVDHINGVRSDNRIDNLREVTAAENARNMALSSRNTSGKHGVCWIKSQRKWRAHMALGMFETKEEAIAAREYAEKLLSNFHPNHGNR